MEPGEIGLPNTRPFGLSGRWACRWRSLLQLYQVMLTVSARRVLRGPRLPSWGWGLEISIAFLRAQSRTALHMPSIADARDYGDSLVFYSAALDQVRREPVNQPVKGIWYQPNGAESGPTVLYLHGGGFAYYARSHHNLIALVAQAAGANTFALDYRLSPEHAYPAQVEDALAAYRWLLETGLNPRRVVLAGDSAGGNLAIALLCALRAQGLPLPALAVCLSPWLDLSNCGASMQANQLFDWIDRRMAEHWAGWYAQGADRGQPELSPGLADLAGLPPIYIQAGEAEVLLDMIRAFEAHARAQGADVRLETWPDMVHDFQAFGDLTRQSQDALRRIREVIGEVAK